MKSLLRALILLGTCCGWYVPAHAQSGVVPLDSIVAVINDDVVLASELREELRAMRAQLRERNIRPPEESVLRKQVLDRMISLRLQVQAARIYGMRVSDDQLNAALEDIARRNKLSLRGFRDALEADGYKYAAFRERIRSQIMVGQIRRRIVQSRVKVADREIQRYIENEQLKDGADDSVLVAQILMEIPEGASSGDIAEARSRGEEVLEELRQGGDFSEMAVAYSDGRNALDGGKIGWRTVDELPAAFGGVLSAMKVGEYSGLVRTPNGFHIVKLVQKRAGERHVVQQTRARHIVIAPGEFANEEEVVKRLETLRERIVNGEEFGRIARAHSEDRAALRNGDLGWVSPGDMVPAFERQMDLLDESEVSTPFRTQFGWHIVQVTERRDFDSTDVVRKQRAREAISKRKESEEIQTWLRQLRDEAYVELRLEED